MSRPVMREPGTFYIFSRRVDRRECRLRPGQSFDHAVGLLIGKAAKDFGMLVIQLVVMSNHVHIVFYDPVGLASEFTREAMSSIARLANHVQGRRGQFWQQHTGRELKALADIGAVIDAVAYCYVNPTRAGLVAHPSAWPGLNTDPALIGTGKTITYERDDVFFAKDGTVGLTEDLQLQLPEDVDAASFREQVAKIVAAKVEAIREQLRAEGRTFVGHAAIVSADIFAAPPTSEVVDLTPKRVERVGARDPEVKRHAVAKLLAFERAYAECRERLAAGEEGVVFPAGTYHLWRHRGVKRQDDPPLQTVGMVAT